MSTNDQKSTIESRRDDLLSKNIAVWNTTDTTDDKKYDSSLKKNTAFIKKVKTGVSEAQCLLLVRDITTLSLEKYLPEVYPAVYEGFCKVSKPEDVAAALEVATELHIRFKSEFVAGLMGLFFQGLDPTKTTVIRQRNLLRLFMEFNLIGLFRTLEDVPKQALPEKVAKQYNSIKGEDAVVIAAREVLSYDIKLGIALPIATAFLKRYGDSLLPKLRALFVAYSESSFKILQSLASETEKLTRSNRERSLRMGKIPEEDSVKLEEQQQLLEKFQTACEFLAEHLDLKLPQMTAPDKEKTESSVELVKNTEIVDTVWENSAERDFYTKVPSLESLNIPSEHQEDDAGSRMTAFLAKLAVAGDEDVVPLVVDFNRGLNNKASHQRIRRLCTESNNFSNFKIVAKFLKINETSLASTIGEIIVALDERLRGQIYHDKLNFRSVYFFVELVKFKLIPTHVVFHKIRKLILNIKNIHNTDILSVFFEQCGRFLLHDADYRPFMIEMMDLLLKEQKNQNLTIHDKSSIRNLMVMVDPPDTKIAREAQPLKSEQRFLLHLFHNELSNGPTAISKITEILKKVNWSTDKEVYQTLESIFSRPQDVNFENISKLAAVFKLYLTVDKQLFTRVVDTIVENVIRGLELDDYKLKRDRLCEVRYLGELYKYGLIRPALIESVLFVIITYGHPNNQPLPGLTSGYDDCTNYFRLHLCMAMAKPIASELHFSRKLLALLDFYYHCKEQPLPIELEHELDEFFALSGVMRCISLSESIAKLKAAIESEKSSKQKLSTDQHANQDAENEVPPADEELDDARDLDALVENTFEEDEDEDEEDEDEDEEDEVEVDETDDFETEAYEEQDSSLDELNLDDTDYESNESSSDDDNYEDDLAAAELDKEFLRIVVDSYNRTKAEGNRSTKLNVPVPRMNSGLNGKSQSICLVTRKGKNIDVRPVNFTDNRGVDHSKKEEEARRHREKIMNLVLNME